MAEPVKLYAFGAAVMHIGITFLPQVTQILPNVKLASHLLLPFGCIVFWVCHEVTLDDCG